MDSFVEVLEINSTDTLALSSKGSLLGLLDRDDEAMVYLDRILSQYSNDIITLDKKAFPLHPVEKECDHYNLSLSDKYGYRFVD